MCDRSRFWNIGCCVWVGIGRCDLLVGLLYVFLFWELIIILYRIWLIFDKIV